MDGDDAIHNLASAVDTKLGVAAAGSVSINASTVGNVATAAVTFPAGLFTAPPIIVTSINGNPINCFTGCSSVTAANASIVLVRTASPGTSVVNWYAVQL
jgi:hypothetical protein